jgi:hypothetical protein
VPARYEVRPNPSLVIYFLLLVAILLAWFVGNEPRVAPWIRIVVLIGSALVAGAMIWLAILDRRRRIVVDETGIKQWTTLGYREIAWEDVTRYRYASLHQSIFQSSGGGKLALTTLVIGTLHESEMQRARGANRYFGLGHLDIYTTAAAKPLRISKQDRIGGTTGYDDLSDLVGLVLDELHARLRSPGFSPLQIVELTLRHANGNAVALADIGAIHVFNGELHLVTRSRQQWPAMPMATIDNSLLLFEQLSRHGVVVMLGPEVFVPPSFRRVT